MAINKNIFIHDTDKVALQALKSIPGFTQVLKAFMKVWNEKLFYIENMATNVKLSEEQLPQYYEMLPPICDKLGIEVPDLFLKLDVVPNAYTYGDTKPFIVLTSGLVETLPDELIPTVLAHECGHIACRHVLYRTMGNMILNGTFNFIPITNIAITPISAAFSYWMRCSELSADRAAVLCDGTTDKVVEMCMRFAGFDKDMPHDMNLEAFMNQAVQYEELVKENIWNKALAYFSFYDQTHPINAVRAYECKKWEESEDFIKSKQFFDAYKKDEKPKHMPINFIEKKFLNRTKEDVEKELLDFGFYDVELIRSNEKSLFTKENMVTNVSINGSDKYKEGDWAAADSTVEVTYYLPFSEEEIIAMHPGEIKMPEGTKHYLGRSYEDVKAELIELGFYNIETDIIKDITKEKDKKLGKVDSILIDRMPKVSKGEWVPEGALIEITYHDLL